MRASEASTLRASRIRAVIKFYTGICKRRGLSQFEKDKILEEYLIKAYGLADTARRDYMKEIKIRS